MGHIHRADEKPEEIHPCDTCMVSEREGNCGNCGVQKYPGGAIICNWKPNSQKLLELFGLKAELLMEGVDNQVTGRFNPLTGLFQISIIGTETGRLPRN